MQRTGRKAEKIRLQEYGKKQNGARWGAGRCTGTGSSVLTILQVRNWFQKEAPSSKLNRTPPAIGATAYGTSLCRQAYAYMTLLRSQSWQKVPRRAGWGSPEKYMVGGPWKNRSLPTGAPNAADTPAAAPAETKSRFSVSLRKYSKIWRQGQRGRVSARPRGHILKREH